MSFGGSAVLMMHSVRDVTEDAVRVLRAAYSGPVGEYRSAGYWTRPNWTFVDQDRPTRAWPMGDAGCKPGPRSWADAVDPGSSASVPSRTD